MRTLAQLQVELLCRWPQGVERGFDVVCSHAMTLFQCLQAVFVLAEESPSLVAPRVTGHFRALIEDAYARDAGADHDRLTSQVRGD